MSFLQIGFSVLLLLGNAFFVGAEFALVSVRRSQVEPQAEAGDRRARSVRRRSWASPSARCCSARWPNRPSPTCWRAPSTPSGSPTTSPICWAT
jgi:hypothetical protein